MTTYRNAAGAAVALAFVLALSSCTGSDGSSAAGSSSPTRAGGDTSSAPGSPGGTSSITRSSSSPNASVTGPSTADSGTAASAVPTRKPAPATHTKRAPASPLSTSKVQGAHHTYRVKVWAKSSTKKCASEGFGTRVVRFLRAHPCLRLHRDLGSTSVNGHQAGFARSTIAFTGAPSKASNVAADFQLLLEKSGAGSIVDLLNEGSRLPSGPARIPSPDARQIQLQDNTVVVADAWYLSGRTPERDPGLTEMLQDLQGVS